MKFALPAASLAITTLLAAAAHGAIFGGFSATDIKSDGTLSQTTDHGIYSFTFSGLSNPFTLKSINVSGTVERGTATTDRLYERRIGLSNGNLNYSTTPAAPWASPAAYSGTPLGGSVTDYAWNVTDFVVTNGTTLRFNFYESAGDPGIDAMWRTLSMSFDGDPYVATAPTIATSNNYGTLSGNGITATKTGSIFQTGQTNWYSFTLDKPVGAGGYKFLDIDTNIPGNTALDTEIALYDANGNLVAQDDEDGTSFKSALSFGAGSGVALNPGETTPVPSVGQDGTLAAGTYYLAVAPFNATFFNDAWLLNGGASSGGYWLNLNLGAVPEPASLAALAISSAILGRRRRA